MILPSKAEHEGGNVPLLWDLSPARSKFSEEKLNVNPREADFIVQYILHEMNYSLHFDPLLSLLRL